MVSTSTVDQQITGKLYIQCCLDELGHGDADAYIKQAAHKGEVELENAVGAVYQHMLTKVRNGERWKIPAERCHGDDEKSSGSRAIGKRHPKEMAFAFRCLIHVVRQQKDEYPPHLSKSAIPPGWFTNLCGKIYGAVVSQVESQANAAQSAKGKEAAQKREATLYAEEWVRPLIPHPDRRHLATPAT